MLVSCIALIIQLIVNQGSAFYQNDFFTSYYVKIKMLFHVMIHICLTFDNITKNIPIWICSYTISV